MTAHHARISPTAKIVAHLRAETDIPYCRQIADMCDVETTSNAFFNDPGQVESRRALVELRFKSLNAFIHQLGYKQVLEFATGVAPRGLVLSEDPLMTVIETDLPEILEEKLLIVESLISLAERKNYQLHSANALHAGEIWDAAGLFEREPLTIVHEGLLQYLGPDERKQLAGNIRSLLQHFGGAWITSDVMVMELFERFYTDTQQTNMLKQVAAATGRNTMDNAFADWDAAIRFFAEEGFAVERFKQIDLVPDIRNHVSDPQVLERIEYEEIWVMRLIN